MIYDIIIIGAGPAAATFARRVAAYGKSILIIDGQSDVRPKPCGGLLAPDAQKLFAHFDFVLPKDVLVDPQIFSVKTIDLVSRRVRYYQRYYMNMDRLAFDRFLLSLIPENVQILQGRCLKAEKKNNLFELEVLAAGERQSLQCRKLIGADGAESIVRRSFFKSMPMQYLAIQQWFRHNDASNPFYSCIFDSKTSESCSWMIYKDEYVIYGGCFEKHGSRAAFDEQKKRLEQFLQQDLGEAVKTEACLVNRPRKMSDFITGKDGVYLIGEAAGFISASSFEGISSAIKSGSLLADAFLQNADEKSIAKAYHRSTLPLRCKLMTKTVKRWFMYTPWVRDILLRTGISSIALSPDKNIQR